jgi:hypothetical protein
MDTRACGKCSCAEPNQVICGGKSTYYSALQNLGQDPKPLLKESLGDLRASLGDAGQAGIEAYDLCRLLSESKGELDPKLVDSFRDRIKTLERALESVRGFTRSSEDLALAHFRRWSEQSEKISEESLRHASRQNLHLARDRYTNLMSAQRDARTGLENLAGAYGDLLLFADTNPSGQSMATLKKKLPGLSDQLDGCTKLAAHAGKRLDEFLQALER